MNPTPRYPMHSYPPNSKIAVVDENQNYLQLVEHILKENKTTEVKTFNSLEEFSKDNFSKKAEIIVVDFAAFEQGLTRLKNEPAIVLLAGTAQINNAFKFIEKGVFECLTKDLALKQNLLGAIEKIQTIQIFNSQIQSYGSQMIIELEDEMMF